MKNFLKYSLISTILCGQLWANELVDQFDIRFYNPSKLGLKDLVFKVKISGLKDKLKKQLTIPFKSDLAFKVYWISPGKYDIKIEGMPKGFRRLRGELKSVVATRMDFVIPQMLGSKVRSYKLTNQKGKNGTIVKGVDESGQKSVNEIELHFLNDGRMNKFSSRSPMGAQISEMEIGPYSWSKNKWVLKSLRSKSFQGIQKLTIQNNISYQVVDGFGFPKSVQIKTTQELVKPEKENGKSNKRVINTTLTFYDYQVNTGKARRFLSKKVPKK